VKHGEVLRIRYSIVQTIFVGFLISKEKMNTLHYTLIRPGVSLNRHFPKMSGSEKVYS
jgi:hypothetical protein